MELKAGSRQLNKMKIYETKKNIYEIEKKKIELIGTPSSNWPWFEHFDNIFGIIKISGIPNAKDQGVSVINFKTSEC